MVRPERETVPEVLGMSAGGEMTGAVGVATGTETGKSMKAGLTRSIETTTVLLFFRILKVFGER